MELKPGRNAGLEGDSGSRPGDLRAVVAHPPVGDERRASRRTLGRLNRLALALEHGEAGDVGHPVRVGRTAQAIARQLGLTETEQALIYRAAALHDIGKVSVSREILRKPGKLTRSEFEQVKHHTTAGAAILSGRPSRMLFLARQIALNHHECWDGSGYPHGLACREIPLVGRIVAVADVFDALTHDRPYKNAIPVADAVAAIRRLSGSQFDPQIVDAFLEVEYAKLVDLPLAVRGLKRDPLVRGAT